MSCSLCVCLCEFITRNLNCNPFNIMGCLISREVNDHEVELLERRNKNETETDNNKTDNIIKINKSYIEVNNSQIKVNNSQTDNIIKINKSNIEVNNSEYRLLELKFKMQNIK